MELENSPSGDSDDVAEGDEFHKWQTYQRHLGPLWPMGERWCASLFWQRLDQGAIDAMSFIFSNLWIRSWRRRHGAFLSREPITPTQDGTKAVASLAAAGKYRYQPLPSDTHIRLIYISTGADGSAMRVRFSTVSLHNVPPFETLSYVWGSQNATRLIDIEGSSFEVGENLYDALCMLRSGDAERCFWIDALSINQSDPRERSTQVSMMPKIYAASQRTTIWLGAGANISAETMELLTIMAKSYEETRDVIVTLEEEVWRELGDLYANPWFYRVWIIQEVAMAHEILILLNGEPWPWAAFAQASYNALNRGFKFQSAFDPESMLRLERIRAAFRNEGPAPTILQALALGRKSLATLDVDKVYGLRGLSVEEFEVNYEEPTTDTYLRLAKSITDKGGAIIMLNYVDDHSFRFKKRLPSWVPDWEVRHGARPLIDTAASINWKASGDHAVYSGLSARGNHLHVHGFVLDTLDRIGNLFMEEVPLSGVSKLGTLSTGGNSLRAQLHSDFILGIVSRRVTQWRTLALKYGTMFLTEDARYDAYVSTLTAGNTLSGDTQLAAERQGYELWCRVWTTASRMDFKTILSAYDQYSPAEMAQAAGFMRLHIHAAWGRRLYTTRQRGIIGLCPALARRGDLLVIIHGGKTPYIIRNLGNGQFRFIGECYAHGFMHGEATGWNEGWKVEEFVLV
ncbi:heterokaryon incompatibility protein-domain-containing protein [Nemania abortiva]|nr:heterokaryon incompatibility protein-domain-containing protein [Nemania abortiva]